MASIPEGDKVCLVDLPEGLQVWERLPDEPGLWFSRFADFYLALPGSRRSMLQAYRNYRREKDIDKASNVSEIEILQKKAYTHVRSYPEQWFVLSKLWRWKERALCKDSWDRKQRSRERQQWLRELEEEEWKASVALRDRAKEMMEYPIVTKSVSEDGQTVIIAPTRWAACDVARYWELSSRLGRMASGAPEKTMETLEALRVLVDAGWLPDTVIDETAEGLHHLRDRVMRAFHSMQSEDFDDGTTEKAGEIPVVDDL